MLKACSHDVAYLGVMGLCPHDIGYLSLKVCIQVMLRVWVLRTNKSRDAMCLHAEDLWPHNTVCLSAESLGSCDTLYESVKGFYPRNSVTKLNPCVLNMLHVCTYVPQR